MTILSSLNQLYSRLATQVDSVTGLPRVPQYGFTDENISYCLVLTNEGELVDIEDVRDTTGKKPSPKRIAVPRPEKRTSGVKSNFLWDKTAYVLGVEGNKDKKTAKETPWFVADKTFAAFKVLHLDSLKNIEDAGLKAVFLFLKQWQASNFANPPFNKEHIDANMVFKLDGENQFVHQSQAAQALWFSMIKPESEEENQATGNQKIDTGICLVTGEIAPLSRLHPAIKGIYGGQSSGGSIISFNKDSFTSFNKAQGDNAPVSEAAAFAYTTALNYLLRRENQQCISIGDASTVFWAEAENAEQEQAAVNMFDTFVNPPNDEQESAALRPILEKISKARPLQEINPNIEPSTRFFILGLAPNASRISIRFWMESSFGEIAKNLTAHWQDLQLEPLAWKAEHPPSMWRCLIQTAVLGKTENIPPQLAGELFRSILTGQRYPRILLTQLVQRIRADGDISGLRVALIKAVLHRDFRLGFTKEDMPMSLELDSTTPIAYRLGCLFATLESAQRGALGGEVNATIVDKYYGTASSVPYSVFPRLLAGCQNHLSKIRKEKPGFAVNLDKSIGQLVASLPTQFPKHLNIEQQGQFSIGYYQQKQIFFTKKEKEDTTDSLTN